MLRLLRSLPALALAAGLAVVLTGPAQAQPPASPLPQPHALVTWLSQRLRALREDVDIDLPDARGVTVGAIVDRCVMQVRQMQRSMRDGVPAPLPQLHKQATELAKELQRLEASLAGLGSDAYYLRKATVPIISLNQTLLKVTGPATLPPQVVALADQMLKELRALREDTDIDLSDARGKTVGELIDRCVMGTRHLEKSAREGASPAHVRKHALDLGKDLQRIQSALAGMGSDAYYLRKSAARIVALNQSLLKLLPAP